MGVSYHGWVCPPICGRVLPQVGVSSYMWACLPTGGRVLPQVGVSSHRWVCPTTSGRVLSRVGVSSFRSGYRSVAFTISEILLSRDFLNQCLYLVDNRGRGGGREEEGKRKGGGREEEGKRKGGGREDRGGGEGQRDREIVSTIPTHRTSSLTI